MYNSITHAGVKGMKWGRRKTPQTETASTPRKKMNPKTKKRLIAVAVTLGTTYAFLKVGGVGGSKKYVTQTFNRKFGNLKIKNIADNFPNAIAYERYLATVVN